MITNIYGGAPGSAAPNEKAPDACDIEGLWTDTNDPNFASHGPIQQAPDSKAIANQIAVLALAGHAVIRGDRGDFIVCKYYLTRYCADFAELQAYARQLGVNHE
jgi:hypothetical protein